MDTEMVSDLHPVIPDMVPVHRRQPSFREKFLFYLKTNAKPKLSLKMMQSSRYFCFREFPFLVIKDLTNINHTWECLSLGKNEDLKIVPVEDGEYAYCFSNFESIDLDNLEKPLWIINKFEVWHGHSSTQIASELIPKLAYCQLKELFLANQILTMKEFEFLVSAKTVEHFDFYPSQVKYPDGSIVAVDEIVKFMPKLKQFSWYAFDMPLNVTPATTKNLIKYLNPSILTHFELAGIPDTFDFPLFVEFMDKYPSITFSLNFYGPPISDAYSDMLQTYVDKLLETGVYKARQIMVSFPRLSQEQNDILREEYQLKFE